MFCPSEKGVSYANVYSNDLKSRDMMGGSRAFKFPVQVKRKVVSDSLSATFTRSDECDFPKLLRICKFNIAF